VWDALDEKPSINTLRSRFDRQADEVVAKFCDAGWCDSVCEPPAGRRCVLVFEPHSDDAALSVGGTMWLHRNDIEFTLVTLGSRSNYTSYWFLKRDYFDVEQITKIRNAEDAIFMHQLGGKHIALDFLEATLRYNDTNWSLDFFQKHHVAVAAFNNHSSTNAELELWKEAVKKILEDTNADEIWIPLGIGTHADHVLTRNACLSVLIENTDLAKNCTIKLFQDVPYDSTFCAHTRAVIKELKRSGASLVPNPQSIDKVFDQKLKLLSIYASQFKVSALQKDVETSGRLGADATGMVEHFWHLEKRPTTLDMPSLSIDKELIDQIATKLSRWLQRHRDVKCIRLLLLMPSGRWATDIQVLMEVFPQTRFDVYVSPAATAEVDSFHSSRLRVHHIGAGGKAWSLLAMRLALSRPTPTAFIAGTARLREANLLVKLWPMSDSVVVSTMDHFVLALRQASKVSKLK
jgi:LmbE family N-acetylglucosaminyl deacetylase